MCEREVALDRRTAPALYLGARRVTRAADGGLALDGAGTLVDAIVEMRRFDADALLDRLAARGGLAPSIVEALARTIAHFHDNAQVVRDIGGSEAMRRVETLCEAKSARRAAASADEIDAHNAMLRALLTRNAALLDARHARGKSAIAMAI